MMPLRSHVVVVHSRTAANFRSNLIYYSIPVDPAAAVVNTLGDDEIHGRTRIALSAERRGLFLLGLGRCKMRYFGLRYGRKQATGTEEQSAKSM